MSDNQVNDGPILTSSVVDILSEWLLYVSAALIVSGLLLPSVYRPKIIGGETYNIVDALSSLAGSGLWLLATIVLVFSVIFPLSKTLVAAIIFRIGNKASPRAAHLMGFLGKWSMLDVFLVAMLVALTQLSELRSIEPRAGLYLFAAGVILNNLATARLSMARMS
ncbi:MAG: paraquat-inducible protein A [Pseudomonadota bacterium]